MRRPCRPLNSGLRFRKLRVGCVFLAPAAAAGRRKLVEELILQHGASVAPRDRMGRTPLICAAEQTSEAVCETLVEHGGDVDVNSADVSGATALHASCLNGHDECAKLLIVAKATINNTAKNGCTALHACSGNGHAKCVALLLAIKTCHPEQVTLLPSW